MREPVTVYFGERWDAPLLDGRIHQIPTPIGEQCLHCTEPIMEGDRGLLRTCIRDNASLAGLADGSVEPTHLECDLRSSLGNAKHLSGGCRYTGDCQDEPGTMREQARAVLAYLNDQRRRAGMGPM